MRFLTCLQYDRPIEAIDLVDCGLLSDQPRPNAYLTLIDEPMKDAKKAVVGEFERLYIDQALDRANGNIGRAAQASGKHRRAFFELMRKHGLSASGYHGNGGVRD